MRRLWFQTFFHPDPAPSGAPGTPPPADDPEPHRSGFDMDRAARKMVTEFRGNVRQMAKHFIAEGRRYRERIRQLTTDLNERPAMEEGGAVLSKEENQRWQKLKGLAADVVDKVGDRLKRADEADAADAQRARDTAVAGAAPKLGVKRPQLLAKEMRDRGMEITEKEVTVRDARGQEKKEKVPHARKIGAKDTDPTTPLDKWIDEQLGEYKELLMSEPQQQPKSESDTSPRDSGYPSQSGIRGRAPNNDPAATYGSRYKSPGELAANKGA